MKPFILICGAPHSYTSMISKFLIDNGAYAKEIWDNPNYDIPYSRYEDKEIWKFMDKKQHFKNYDLKNYFTSLPKDKVFIAKEPGMVFFINDLTKYTDRTIKIVFVIRDIEQIILSSMEKSNKGFIFYFERFVWMYRFIVNCPNEVFFLISERIKKDGEQLLEFCDLSVEKVDYGSIKNMRMREAKYIKYRFANFFWKKLSRLFQVF